MDEAFDLRDLEVGLPGQAPARKLQSRFVVAMRHMDPAGTFAPPTQPGAYDVFVSVGLRDGTPKIELPLPGGDGQRRYKMGTIQLR